MGNLCPGMPAPSQRAVAMPIRRSPNGAGYSPSTAWSRSPGMGGRNQSERLVAINRNRWSQSAGTPTQTFERRLLGIINGARRGADNHTASSPLSHDRWVYLLASSFGRVVVLAEPLADYRQYQANQFGQKANLLDSLRGALTESYDRLAKHRDIAAYRADLFSQVAGEIYDRNMA